MSKVSDYISSMQTAVEAAGYTWSNQVFDLEEVPKGSADMCYRWEESIREITENSGSRLQKTKEISFYFSFSIPNRGDRKARLITIADYKESLEDIFYSTITDTPVTVVVTESQPMHDDDYKVVKFSADVTYWRDLS